MPPEKLRPALPRSSRPGFGYNQDFKSVYAMVPATIALLLVLIPAILMALAIVREKELGSIINLYVTPVTRIEFLLGKQIPYVGVAMVNFAMLLLMALFVFGVPLKGSLPTLALGALLYVAATTGYGMLISSFTRTQIAALFGTAILTRGARDTVLRHADAGVLPVRRRRSHRTHIPDDLFPPDQRRHLHQRAGLRRSRINLVALAPLCSGADAAEPRLPAQARAVARRLASCAE